MNLETQQLIVAGVGAIASTGSLVMSDFPAWYMVALFVTLMLAILVFFASVWSAWRFRRDVARVRAIQSRMYVVATILLAVGAVSFALSFADACMMSIGINGPNAKLSMLANSLAGILWTFSLPIMMVGVMVATALSMPWIRK